MADIAGMPQPGVMPWPPSAERSLTANGRIAGQQQGGAVRGLVVLHVPVSYIAIGCVEGWLTRSRSC